MKIKFIKDHTSPMKVEVKGETKTKQIASGIKAGREVDTHNHAWAKKMIDDGFAEAVDATEETTTSGKKAKKSKDSDGE